MTIDKISPNFPIGTAEAGAARGGKINPNGQNGKAGRPELRVLNTPADVVRVSTQAKEMLQAVRNSGGEDTFDQARVESIRREIREGRFPIDEDRLARKFRELEKELGDLG
jgi:flagellar biosynthesis anti-sigma factor FlgM